MSTFVIIVVALLGGLALTEIVLRVASWSRTRDRTATLPTAPPPRAARRSSASETATRTD